MANVALFKQDGTQNGEVTLNDAIFGIEPNENVVFDAIIMQRASLRQGNHSVKNRSAVRGGGRKPWRQKGTGRARQGSIRSPQKVRRLAIKSGLSTKVAENNLIVVDALNFDAPKTKEFAQVLKNLNVDQKVLVVVESDNDFATLSARNLPGVKVVTHDGITVLDVVSNVKMILTQTALTKVEEALK